MNELKKEQKTVLKMVLDLIKKEQRYREDLYGIIPSDDGEYIEIQSITNKIIKLLQS